MVDLESHFLFSLFSDTRIVQVFAEDRDAIDGEGGPNGQIVYSIVSQHNKFNIDPETGWLSTSAVRQTDNT